MRRLRRVVVVIALCAVIFYGLLPHAWLSALPAPSGTILIGQIKLTTGSQFVSLYNNTNSDIDMSTVQLAYYNYYDLTSPKLTTSRFIPLSGKLASHQYYVVSEGVMSICYKMTVSTDSLGFSTTAGTVQVIQNGPSNVLDSIAYSKTAVTTPASMPSVWQLPTASGSFMQRAWVEGVSKTPGDAWINVSSNPLDNCDLQTQIAASATPSVPTPTAAPQKVTVVKAEAEKAAPNSNLGLVAPELTELLPNPGAPQSDDADEFIELYNPNDSIFSLKDYRIEAGTTYSRGHTFKEGSLQPKSYTALMITDTNLQLSNGEGQVRLLSPDATVISETPGYEDAPDGESWSLVSDSWQWSETPTPGAANSSDVKVKPEPASASTVSKTAAKKSTGKVAGVSTTTPAATEEELDDAAPLHPLVLAGVGAAAVAYAIYEYRKDMANRFFQARRYFRNRRVSRATL